MPRLLLLLPSSTYRAEAFLDAARRLSLDVTVAAEPDALFEGRAAADCLPLDFGHPDEGQYSCLTPIPLVTPIPLAHFSFIHLDSQLDGVQAAADVMLYL